MYKCVIWSHSSYGREYDVTTRSAYKAAYKLGRCELGEVVQIRTRSGKVLSEARWENGRYHRTLTAR